MMKKILNALLRPWGVLIAALIPVSGAMLFFAFYKYSGEGVVAYTSYFVSAYTLTVVCIRIPEIIAFTKKLRRENKYVKRYFDDKEFRSKTSLYISLAMNTAFAIFQLCLGLYHNSVWFYSIAAYYILLVIMRYYLLRYANGNKLGGNITEELKKYRFCGICLMIMTLALALIVFFMTYWGRTFTHHYITTIAIATFTFEALISAIIGAVKGRRDKSPAFMAINTVSIASALVSMLMLEVTMLNVFGNPEQAIFNRLMIELFGAFVTVFILTLSIIITVKTTKEIRKTEKAHE